jgi:GT2 family glycosyltransferase
MHSPKETLSIGWCDGGMVDGKFMEGVLNTSLYVINNKINLLNSVRVQGNQIGRQRQVLFDGWADQVKSDWLLWVDSDIVLTPQVFKMVWDAADKISKPVVCGTYFVSKENERSLMEPFPTLFKEGRNEFELEIIHPLPDNELIQVDSAGFGFVLMHKSIIEPMRNVSPEYSLFAEKEGIDDEYVSEDIVFFRNLKRAGIKLYAHTGAIVQHMKRFAFDIEFYKLYWVTHMVAGEKEKKAEA